MSNQEPVSESSGLSHQFSGQSKAKGYVCKGQDQFTVVTKIRQQANKWQRKDDIDPNLKAMKENTHFTTH